MIKIEILYLIYIYYKIELHYEEKTINTRN